MSKAERTRAYRTPLANVVAVIAALAMVIGGAFVPVTATAAPGVAATDEVAATIEPSPSEVTPEPAAEATDEASPEATGDPSAEPSASPSASATAEVTDEATEEPDPCVATDEDGNIVESEATEECATELEEDDELVGGKISSDKGTYEPGSTVVLSGSGWADDSAVDVKVVDAANGNVVHAATVDVTGSGSIFTTFVLPKTFVPSFDVTAKGADSKFLAELSFAMALADVSIASDLDDYPPGGLVTLTGAGWRGDEQVHVLVNDTLGRTWQRDVDVTVNDDGTITDSFNLPDYFVSDYDVTATGKQTARIATTTFTDSNKATITVRKGGKRTGVSTVENLSGATFAAYAKGVGSDGMNSDLNIPAGSPVTTCTTDATGTCALNVTWNSATSGQNRDAARFLIVEQTAPTGYTVITDISTSDGDYYRFNQQVANDQSYTLPGTDRWWANRKTNPAWPGRCGMNIAMLFDESTSISDTEFDQMQAAAKGFVNALKGTPSRIAVFSFSTNAPANNTKALTSIQSDADATAMNTWIDGMTQAGGYTNWDAGLYQIAQSSETFDVVLFLTDGDPTRYGTPASGSGTNTTTRFVEEAVHSANAVKAKSNGSGGFTRIVGVGIGVPSGSEKNLAAVTGTSANDDYFVTSFSALEAKLKDIASIACGGKVLITKSIGTALPGALDVESNGWTFTTSIAGSNGTATPASGQTANVNNFDGQLQVELAGGTWPKTVTVTEASMKGDFQYVDLACTGGTNVSKDNANRKVTLTIASGATVTCNFVNKRLEGTLKIVKTLDKGGATFSGDFKIDYTCTATGRPAKTGTVTITNAGNQSVTVPAGYTCSVSEQTRPAAPEGYTWNDPIPITFVPAGGAITSGQTTTATVANVLTGNQGSLKITKTINGGPGGFTGPFTVNWNCGTGYTDSSTTLSSTTPVTVSGIPAGRTCSVTEPSQGTPPTGYSWSSKVIGSDVTIVANTEKTIAVTNTLTRDTGSLELQKQLTGGPGALTFNPDYVIHYVCDAQHTGDVNLKDGASATITGIPTGTECTITEPNLPAAPGGWSWGTTTFTPANKVTITTKDTTYTVTANNVLTRDTGTIELKKSWSGTGGQTTLNIGTTNGGQEVDHQLTGLNGGTPLSTGINTVSTGTFYLSETGGLSDYDSVLTCVNAAGGNVPLGANNSVQVGKGDAITCTFTNTRKTAQIELKKVWVGVGGSTTLQIGTSQGSGSKVSQPVGANGGTTGVVTVDTGRWFVSESGGLGDFTSALSCLLNGGAAFDPANGQLDLAKDDSVVCTYTNTRKTGSIQIEKILQNQDGASVQSAFNVDLECKIGSTVVKAETVALAADQTKTISGIQVGAVCTATEQARTDVPDFTWAPVSVSGSPTAAVTTANNPKITVTNTITRDRGSLLVTKTLSNPGGAVTQSTYTFDLSCTVNDVVVFTRDNAAVTTAAPALITGIPSRALCTITEDTLTPVQGFTWATPVVTNPSAIVAGQQAQGAIANAITRDNGTLEITKSVTGGPAGHEQAGEFKISYLCTPPAWTTGEANITGTELIESGEVFSRSIPTGYTCSATESTADNPQAPARYHWGSPSYSPASTVIASGTAARLTVTNPLDRDLGSLDISKVLVNEDQANTQTSFTVDVICTYDGTTSATFDDIVITAGQTTRLSNIPTGSTCVVTEQAPTAVPGHTWAVDVNPATSAAVELQATPLVTVTNTITRDRGTLRVTKTLAGGTVETGRTFTVTYLCTISTPPPNPQEPIEPRAIQIVASGTLDLLVGVPQTVPNLPTGATCVVTEQALTNPPSGFTWGTPVLTPNNGEVQITERDQIVDVTVANTLNSIPTPPPPTPTPPPAPPTPPVEPTPEPVLPTAVEPTPEPALPTPVEPTPEPANPVIPASVPAGDGPLGIPLWSWALLLAGFVGVLGAGIRLVSRKEE